MASTNKIYYNDEQWALLKMNHSRDEIIDMLWERINKPEDDPDRIDFPYKDLTPEQAEDSFNELIMQRSMGPVKTTQPMCTRFDYSDKYPFSSMIITEGIQGIDASGFFQQKPRMKVGRWDRKSPIQVWSGEKTCKSVLKSLFTLKMSNVTDNSLRSAIQLKTYMASQFRPAVARSIYLHFNAKNILDISAGWGDRLCGAYSIPTVHSYYGIDPNKEVYDGYYKQVELYKGLINKKDTHFFNMPAEEALAAKDDNGEYLIPSDYFDLMFTSPPYFKAERYVDETEDVNNAQSCNRYSDVEAWLRGFMYPTIDGIHRALKSGGYCVWNISDVSDENRKGGRCCLCDPMNDYMEKKGFEFVGYWGMLMQKRPQSKTTMNKAGNFFEPVWVWRKK